MRSLQSICNVTFVPVNVSVILHCWLTVPTILELPGNSLYLEKSGKVVEFEIWSGKFFYDVIFLSTS